MATKLTQKKIPVHPVSSPEKGRLGGVLSRSKAGVSDFITYNPKLKEYARQNRQNPTAAEQKMWQILRDKQFGHLKFTRQKPLLTFIADFYCAELSLVIEIDGDSHAEQEEYDNLRGDILKERFGIEVLRFNNADVLQNTEGVYDSLEEYVKEKTRR